MSKGFHNNRLIVNTSNTKERNFEIQDELDIDNRNSESSNLERMSSMGNEISQSLSKSFFDKEKDGEAIPVLNEIDFPLEDHRHSLRTNEQPIKLLNRVPNLQKPEQNLIKHAAPNVGMSDASQTADARSVSTSLIEKESRKKTVWKDAGPSIEVGSKVHRVGFQPFIDQSSNLHLEAKRQKRKRARPCTALLRVLCLPPADAQFISAYNQNR